MNEKAAREAIPKLTKRLLRRLREGVAIMSRAGIEGLPAERDFEAVYDEFTPSELATRCPFPISADYRAFLRVYAPVLGKSAILQLGSRLAFVGGALQVDDSASDWGAESGVWDTPPELVRIAQEGLDCEEPVFLVDSSWRVVSYVHDNLDECERWDSTFYGLLRDSADDVDEFVSFLAKVQAGADVDVSGLPNKKGRQYRQVQLVEAVARAAGNTKVLEAMQPRPITHRSSMGGVLAIGAILFTLAALWRSC